MCTSVNLTISVSVHERSHIVYNNGLEGDLRHELRSREIYIKEAITSLETLSKSPQMQDGVSTPFRRHKKANPGWFSR